MSQSPAAVARSPCAAQPGPRGAVARPLAAPRPPVPARGGVGRGGLHSCGRGGIRAASPVCSRASCTGPQPRCPPGPALPGWARARPQAERAGSPHPRCPRRGAPGQEAALGRGLARGSLPGVRGVAGRESAPGCQGPRVVGTVAPHQFSAFQGSSLWARAGGMARTGL